MFSDRALAGSTQVRYRRPVDGAVLRGFDPPDPPYSAGHRGVDLEAAAGDVVRTAAPGRVAFAGALAGSGWVSVQHDDGIVTTYGVLGELAVAPGVTVVAGQPLGRLENPGHDDPGPAHGLHWGARRNGRYVDPLELLEGRPARPSLVGSGRWDGADHAVRPYEPWEGARAGGWLVEPSPTATRPGFAVPPNPNRLVLVQGLASSSNGQLLDAEQLGYDPSSVIDFAYPSTAEGDEPDGGQDAYSAADTWAGTGPAAEQLAEDLRAHAEEQPGRAVDLVGHSMGGVVIWRYLLEHHDAYDPTLPPIGQVATIAAPLRGSDLAAAGKSLLDGAVVGSLLRDAQARFGIMDDQVPLDAPAIGELAVGSTDLAELAASWELARSRGAAGPLAMGTRLLTIGGSKDPVVLADRARLPEPSDGDAAQWLTGEHVVEWDRARRRERIHGDGFEVEAEHRVLPGGHEGVTETEAVNQSLWRFLAGQEVSESPGRLSSFVGRELGFAARSLAELGR
ncbi:MAG: peptidoglycan DD-metalloendopeptidase family protein [Nitriliruptoraceae bacterium]